MALIGPPVGRAVDPPACSPDSLYSLHRQGEPRKDGGRITLSWGFTHQGSLCDLRGYPKVWLLDKFGFRIDSKEALVHDEHGITPETVPLGPHGIGYFRLSFKDGTFKASPRDRTQCEHDFAFKGVEVDHRVPGQLPAVHPQSVFSR